MSHLKDTDFTLRGRRWLSGWADSRATEETPATVVMKAAMLIVFEGAAPARVARGLGMAESEARGHAHALREALADAIAFGRLSARDLLRDPTGRESGEMAASEKAYRAKWMD